MLGIFYPPFLFLGGSKFSYPQHKEATVRHAADGNDCSPYRERNWQVVCFCLCVGFLVCNEFPFLCSSLLLLSMFPFCWQFYLLYKDAICLWHSVAPVAEWFPLQGSFLPFLLLLMFFLRPSPAKLFFIVILFSSPHCWAPLSSFSGFLLCLRLLTKLFFLWLCSFSYFVLTRPNKEFAGSVNEDLFLHVPTCKNKSASHWLNDVFKKNFFMCSCWIIAERIVEQVPIWCLYLFLHFLPRGGHAARWSQWWDVLLGWRTALLSNVRLIDFESFCFARYFGSFFRQEEFPYIKRPGWCT